MRDGQIKRLRKEHVGHGQGSERFTQKPQCNFWFHWQ